MPDEVLITPSFTDQQIQQLAKFTEQFEWAIDGLRNQTKPALAHLIAAIGRWATPIPVEIWKLATDQMRRLVRGRQLPQESFSLAERLAQVLESYGEYRSALGLLESLIENFTNGEDSADLARLILSVGHQRHAIRRRSHERGHQQCRAATEVPDGQRVHRDTRFAGRLVSVRRASS